MSQDAIAAPELVRRFSRFDRILHGLLMISFIGLAFTGLPLLFSTSGWAPVLARALGGFETAGGLHRVFAVVMLGVFGTHVGDVMHGLFVRKDLSMLWGPTSMVPQPRDVREMIAHMRWFVGLGPQPKFDHFTYWEKFDYWAVFWGMGIIGGSGILLAMPETVAHLLPGWVFNLAMLVHGEEALLAMGFIFSFHFFTGHLRPEKFPMDTVMFSGHARLDELRHERSDEYERLVREQRLEDHTTGEESPAIVRAGRIVGTIAVALGLLMLALIVVGLIG